MHIFFTHHFKKQLKTLAKRFPHIKEDLLSTITNIELQQTISMGKSVYKIRVKSSDMRKGKSGGFRTYMYFQQRASLLVPICIYAKTDQDDISQYTLITHLDETTRELQNNPIKD